MIPEVATAGKRTGPHMHGKYAVHGMSDGLDGVGDRFARSNNSPEPPAFGHDLSPIIPVRVVDERDPEGSSRSSGSFVGPLKVFVGLPVYSGDRSERRPVVADDHELVLKTDVHPLNDRRRYDLELHLAFADEELGLTQEFPDTLRRVIHHAHPRTHGRRGDRMRTTTS